MKTIVKPWGNSQGIRISKELLNLLGIGVNEEVDLERAVYNGISNAIINIKTKKNNSIN